MDLRLALSALLLAAAAFEDEEEGAFPREELALVSTPPVRKNWLLEILIVIGILTYACNFYFGRNKNETIAVNWMKTLAPILEANFSHVGGNDRIEGSSLLQKESPQSYKLYATGRYNCAYVLANLELIKRQDLLSVSVLGFIWPELDRMLVEIPVRPTQASPIVFAVTRRTLLKKIKTSVEDLKSFAKVWKSDDLNKNLSVLGENDEVAVGLLDAKAKSMINSLAPYIQLIHLTDIHSIKASYPLTLQGEFLVPLSQREAVGVMMTLMLHLADLATDFRLSNAARSAAERKRVTFKEMRHKDRKEACEEELASKKADKKKVEEERKASLSKEQLRKLEEKEYKRSLKKSGPRVKVLKG